MRKIICGHTINTKLTANDRRKYRSTCSTHFELPKVKVVWGGVYLRNLLVICTFRTLDTNRNGRRIILLCLNILLLSVLHVCRLLPICTRRYTNNYYLILFNSYIVSKICNCENDNNMTCVWHFLQTYPSHYSYQ